MSTASAKFTKTTWEIAVFHIFYYCKVVQYEEFANTGINLSRKTIIRYVNELEDAGLLHVIFSKKENGYIHIDDSRHCPFLPPKYTQSERQNAHLNKLIRFVTIMVTADDTEYSCWDEEEIPKEDAFIAWYKSIFPDVSRRTMYRDFQELNKIGYKIRYDSFDKQYCICFRRNMEKFEFKEE